VLGVCQKYLIQKTILQNIQTANGAHPVCYWKGNGGCIPGSKTAGVFSWPLAQFHSPPQVKNYEWVELYLHVVHRDKFAFPETWAANGSSG
jgi:hypothetical protein